ncbi:MAG: class I SAM-dependent methyltransferase, partial [Bacteroidales bacterium]|nr:class I SAM-dependent methyltransferase [Bacteroidales bacterium]
EEKQNIAGSFRDPSGFLFKENGKIYRRINKVYADDYEQLMFSGLYNKLVENHLLIPHIETEFKSADNDLLYKIIQPELVQFISYPYEWSFSQLKDAALTTLNIQKIAMEHGMSLKDSTAYNIQFWNGKPVLIDTLSFEKYKEGEPWVAYKQFCQHFLLPLVLMSYTDIRLSQLFRIYIDGIPLDLGAKLLPRKTRFKFSIFAHIHLHAKSQKKYEDKAIEKKSRISKFKLLALIDSLETTVKNLKWNPKGTEWADYYDITNYSSDAFKCKKNYIEEFLKSINPASVWDLGANTGIFSRIASEKNIPTISFDVDPAAVEKNYQICKEKNETNILPLVLDLTNPSGGIGWANQERMSFIERGPVDTVFALALIHHLAISNNLPLINIAEFFSSICKFLIIEFVPKSDSQVKKLLLTREDIFDKYDKENFEKDFDNYFNIRKYLKIEGSERYLYLMEKK